METLFWILALVALYIVKWKVDNLTVIEALDTMCL